MIVLEVRLYFAILEKRKDELSVKLERISQRRKRWSIFPQSLRNRGARLAPKGSPVCRRAECEAATPDGHVRRCLLRQPLLNANSARFSNGSRRIVLADFFISHRNAQSTPDMIPSSLYEACRFSQRRLRRASRRVRGSCLTSRNETAGRNNCHYAATLPRTNAPEAHSPAVVHLDRRCRANRGECKERWSDGHDETRAVPVRATTVHRNRGGILSGRERRR
jgi:hypothetical protein